MGCFVVLFALISARFALVWIWLTGDLLSRAYDSSIVPILGFFLLPWTTLAYAVMWDVGSDGVHGLEVFLVILAFLTDIGAFAGGANKSRRD
jgi:hypothetical protein